MLSGDSKLMFTRRVELRKFRIEDSEEAFDMWMNDKDVKKYSQESYASSIDIAKEKISQYIKLYEDDYFNWNIILRKNKANIGQAFVKNYDKKNDSVEVYVIISKKYRNRGYATEVFSKLMDFFFSELGIKYIKTTAAVENEAWQEVIKKLYFKIESKDDDVINYYMVNVDYMAVFAVIADI
ncbi:MAG: GNAT family N-acetyltransferase [Tissierellia bacterium]|nr:GNAT family N-acetyltransferase [Tissierellia bacterium]